MNEISGLTGLLAPFSVYTIDPSSWGKESKAIQFLGCSFPCSGSGTLVSCSHIIQDIPKNELLVVQHPTESICHKATVIGEHPKFDIAFLQIEAKTLYWPVPIMDELGLASDVWAYGYYDTIVENGTIETIPQVFTGTVTATPQRSFGLLTATPFYQASFPALPGFSGSPLIYDSERGGFLCGMLFGNRSSKVVIRTVEEYKDEKIHFMEKSVREWESGCAHTTVCIKQAAIDLKISIWQ